MGDGVKFGKAEKSRAVESSFDAEFFKKDVLHSFVTVFE